MCIFFHKWSMWKEYIWHGYVYNSTGEKIEITEERQERHCLKCGYTQRKEVDEI